MSAQRRTLRRYDPLAVLAYVATYREIYAGRSPSERRIQRDLGVSAPSVVHNILRRLERDALLTISRYGHGLDVDLELSEAGRAAVERWQAACTRGVHSGPIGKEPMMRPMQHDEIRAFLLSGTRTAKLATVRADGRPHVAPIWFDLDDDGALIFTTWHTTVKAANLRHQPLVSLCVDDERPPFAFVLVDGRATLNDDLDELRRWATRIARRYMGPELAEQYGARNGVAGELLVRVTPIKLIGQTDVSG